MLRRNPGQLSPLGLVEMAGRIARAEGHDDIERVLGRELVAR